MAYTNIDKPTDYFNTVTWSGDDTSPRNITGVGFQPDWIWGKARSRIGNHWLIDSVRGSTGSLYRVLNSDDTASEQTTNNDGTTAYGIVTTIGSDGFTIADGNQGDLNVNNTGDTYVSWNWLAGGTASSNSNGSITSSVSANTTAGFSIVSYTGTLSTDTVGHGLGTTPNIIIVKNRTTAQNWSVNGNAGGLIYGTNKLLLQGTNALISDNNEVTSANTTTFSLSNSIATNESGSNHIAYCFAEKKGYSKFGSYEANNSTDGTFVYTGFKPALIILKAIDQAGDWFIFDNKRDIDNAVSQILYPNLSSSEGSASVLDFVSNGVKIRNSGSGGINYSGTYIYMAFAENPFVTSTGIPACAR